MEGFSLLLEKVIDVIINPSDIVTCENGTCLGLGSLEHSGPKLKSSAALAIWSHPSERKDLISLFVFCSAHVLLAKAPTLGAFVLSPICYNSCGLDLIRLIALLNICVVVAVGDHFKTLALVSAKNTSIKSPYFTVSQLVGPRFVAA